MKSQNTKLKRPFLCLCKKPIDASVAVTLKKLEMIWTKEATLGLLTLIKLNHPVYSKPEKAVVTKE